MMGSAAARDGLKVEDQKILFVGGKGGVGKTTTASSLAVRLSENGERCLLVSTDPAHSLGDLFDRSIGDREQLLAPNLWGLEIDPDAQVEKHLAAVSETMMGMVKTDLHPEIKRQMALARQSPGAVEAAMLERMSELMIDADRRFDRIIFDTAPTGHTLRLLALPEIMAAWTDGLLRQRDRSDSWNAALKQLNPRPGVGDDLSFVDAVQEREDERSSRIRNLLLDRRRKFYQARRMLLDRKTSGFVLVLIPEKLPILESQKAVISLRQYEVPILGMIVNRVLPSEHLGEFLERRREQEEAYLVQIESIFGALTRVHVPLQSRDVEGLDSLREIGRVLLPTL